MTKHTPGPWDFDPVYDKMKNCLVVDNAGGNIQVRTDNITADARLIAAAPDLLEKSKNLMEVLEAYSNRDNDKKTKLNSDWAMEILVAKDEMYAAIAKAEDK